jgi:hypothetical protein
MQVGCRLDWIGPERLRTGTDAQEPPSRHRGRAGRSAETQGPHRERRGAPKGVCGNLADCVLGDTCVIAGR